MGYGSRALELLETYYQGEITNLNEDEEDEVSKKKIKNFPRNFIKFYLDEKFPKKIGKFLENSEKS